jgi:hypothetical protein
MTAKPWGMKKQIAAMTQRNMRRGPVGRGERDPSHADDGGDVEEDDVAGLEGAL